MILLIDNYDSFTFNLQRYFVRLGQEVHVVRNDAPELNKELATKYAAIVISPGPKTPEDAGKSVELVHRYSGRLPILGVCLGHQVVYAAFGGKIGRALRPIHGKATEIELLSSRLFDGIRGSARFARYHSLVGLTDSIPTWLRVIAWSEHREIMAVEHIEHPTFGVQFHPESVLSADGYRVLQNFLHCAGFPDVKELPELDIGDASRTLAVLEQAEPAEHLPVALPGAAM